MMIWYEILGWILAALNLVGGVFIIIRHMSADGDLWW